MLTLEQLLDALTAHGCQPKETRDGWAARCPAHEDSNPSLSVSEGRKRPFVIACHAGCDYKDIMAALGLSEATGGTNGGTRPQPGTKARKRKKREPPKPMKLWSGNGTTLYYYTDAEGTPVACAMRTTKPDGKKQMAQWRPYDLSKDLWIAVAPEENRPLFRLPKIAGSKDKVAVVEGEKCVLACEAAWPGQLVTTWLGGTNTEHLTDWTPLKGREVSLLSDGDKAGRKVMRNIAKTLHALGCDIRIGLVPGEKGEDVADWIEKEGPTNAAQKIGKILRPYRPPAAKPAPEVTDRNLIVDNEHYRLLGLVDDLVAIRISAGRILRRTREALLSPATLIAIAPAAWWEGVAGIEGLTAAAARHIGDALLREADKLGAIDLTHIQGRGAVRLEDGRVAWHLGDRILIDGAEQPLEENSKVWLAEPPVVLTDSAAHMEVVALRKAVAAYRWHTPEDGMRFLGWMAASVAGGALEWRPHVLLTAPAGVGKSWLLREVLEGILGPLVLRIADGSTAAVARVTGVSSLPIAVDEAEPTGSWIESLLGLLRISAGGEGLRLRADATSGGVVAQAPRFSALLSAIAVPQMNAADASRISLIRLGKEVDDWPAVAKAIESAMQAADRIRSKMVRDTAEIARVAKAMTHELQHKGMPSRDALTSAALTAGWAWWGGAEIVRASGTRPELEDATEAVLEILALQVRTGSNTTVSLAEAITSEYEADRAIDLFGVRFHAEYGLYVAPHHKGLKQALQRTSLKNTDLQRLLLQIDQAQYTKHPQRFGSVRQRAVVIDIDTLTQIGVELTWQASEQTSEQSVHGWG